MSKSHSFKIYIRLILDHLSIISFCNASIFSGSFCASDGVTVIFLSVLLALILTSLLSTILEFKDSNLHLNNFFSCSMNSLAHIGRPGVAI